MTAPKWTRPAPRPHNPYHLARLAISDAEHAGDPEYAARILMHTAAVISQRHWWWCLVRPALGVPRARRDEAA